MRISIKTRADLPQRNRQTGATLIVGLILLLTIIFVSMVAFI